MNKKQLQARTERNRELARLDMSNRCSVCKVSLLDRPAIQLMPNREKFCSSCYEGLYTEAERAQLREDGA